jgi:glycyl-tRNA synthetase beta chain
MMDETPGNPREADERKVFARDQQHAPPREGESDVFAGNEPDGIPMTGEEDPFAEVDTDDHADIVAEFAATERPATND